MLNCNHGILNWQLAMNKLLLQLLNIAKKCKISRKDKPMFEYENILDALKIYYETGNNINDDGRTFTYERIDSV